MAKYRMYKNGIFGHRYKGYYIVKNDKNDFKILNGDGEIYKEDINNYDDCEWIIDKECATDEELLIIRNLYSKEIYQLSSLFVELMDKKSKDEFDAKDDYIYKMTEKIRKRKVDDKEY